MASERLPSLAALKAFEAAARLGSFQAAAQTLHLTPSAVSHQIRGLEQEFGQPLFARRHRKVELTEAGRILEGFVARGFEELRRGRRPCGRTGGPTSCGSRRRQPSPQPS